MLFEYLGNQRKKIGEYTVSFPVTTLYLEDWRILHPGLKKPGPTKIKNFTRKHGSSK